MIILRKNIIIYPCCFFYLVLILFSLFFFLFTPIHPILGCTITSVILISYFFKKEVKGLKRTWNYQSTWSGNEIQHHNHTCRGVRPWVLKQFCLYLWFLHGWLVPLYNGASWVLIIKWPPWSTRHRACEIINTGARW